MTKAIAACALAAGLIAGASARAQESEPAPPPAPPAESEGMSGNTQFFIGQAYLQDDAWKPLNEPSSFGFEVDFAPSKSIVHVALGFNVAGDSRHVTSPYFGQTGHVGAGFLEFSAGFLVNPVKHAPVRPYFGAGIVRTFAGVGSGSDFWSGGDSDQSFGYYGNLGIFFKVGDVFNIGLDGRIVRGTSISLAGFDGNVNYQQASLLLGFSWGH